MEGRGGVPIVAVGITQASHRVRSAVDLVLLLVVSCIVSEVLGSVRRNLRKRARLREHAAVSLRNVDERTSSGRRRGLAGDSAASTALTVRLSTHSVPFHSAGPSIVSTLQGLAPSGVAIAPQAKRK